MGERPQNKNCHDQQTSAGTDGAIADLTITCRAAIGHGSLSAYIDSDLSEASSVVFLYSGAKSYGEHIKASEANSDGELSLSPRPDNLNRYLFGFLESGDVYSLSLAMTPHNLTIEPEPHFFAYIVKLKRLPEGKLCTLSQELGLFCSKIAIPFEINCQ